MVRTTCRMMRRHKRNISVDNGAKQEPLENQQENMAFEKSSEKPLGELTRSYSRWYWSNTRAVRESNKKIEPLTRRLKKELLDQKIYPL